MSTSKLTIKDDCGNSYKFQETADLIKRAKIEAYSTSRREYEESHLDATMAMHRAVGFILMAEELEPYNPEVLWEKNFISEMSGKSTGYMRELLVNAIVKYVVCEEHGYTPRKTPLDIMEYAAEDYLRDINKGITYQGKTTTDLNAYTCETCEHLSKNDYTAGSGFCLKSKSGFLMTVQMMSLINEVGCMSHSLRSKTNLDNMITTIRNWIKKINNR